MKLCHALSAAFFLTLVARQLFAAPASHPLPGASNPVRTADSNVAGTIAVPDSLIRVPAPRGLTAAQNQEWSQHTTWLRGVKSVLQTQVRTTGKAGNTLSRSRAKPSPKASESHRALPP